MDRLLEGHLEVEYRLLEDHLEVEDRLLEDHLELEYCLLEGSFPDQVAGGGWLGGAVLDGTGGPARDAGAAFLSGLLDALV